MKHSLGSAALAIVLATATIVGTMPAFAQQPGQPPPAGQATGIQIQGSSLMGSTVRTADGKDLGKVADVMIDPQDGRIASVVISMGGTLGIGAKEMTVPWNAVQVGRDQQRVVLTLQQQVMPTAPNAQDQRRDDRAAPAASPPTGQGQSQPPSQGHQPQQPPR